MDISIGLPSTIPGVTAEQVLEWARRAERREFAALGTIDRLVYGNLESLTTLAAAAAVTERIRLATTILIPTYRGNGALLAKQAATVNHLSGGRLVLGLAPGVRDDDFDAGGEPMAGRGKRFDAILTELAQVWSGEARGVAGAIGPTPPSGQPPILVGGAIAKTYERAAKHGIGWIGGGAPPDQITAAKEQLAAAWSKQGRTDTPRTAGLVYFSLGPDAEDHAREDLTDYYAWMGPETANMIADYALKDDQSINAAVAAYDQAGLDELFLFPCSPDPAQVDLLASAIS